MAARRRRRRIWDLTRAITYLAGADTDDPVLAAYLAGASDDPALAVMLAGRDGTGHTIAEIEAHAHLVNDTRDLLQQVGLLPYTPGTPPKTPAEHQALLKNYRRPGT